MSHDRGCPCGRERYEYADCPRMSCIRRDGAIERKAQEAAKITPSLTHEPYDISGVVSGRWTSKDAGCAPPPSTKRRDGPVGEVRSVIEEDPPLTRVQRDWLFDFIDGLGDSVHHKLNAMEVHVPTVHVSDPGVSDTEPQEFHLLKPVKLRASRSTHSGKYVTRWVYDYGTRPGLTVYRHAEPLRKKT